MRRAAMSDVLPAANPTRIRTGRVGYACACAICGKAGSATAPAARCRNCLRWENFMFCPPRHGLDGNSQRMQCRQRIARLAKSSYDIVEQNPYSVGMTMELRHLRYFIAVAEEGHITRAAGRLGMQQPPLSRQIKAIEREMDVQLFRRKARGVDLTDAGRAFLDDARAMLSHLDHALDTAQRAARGEQGQVSVGYTSSPAFHPLVPRVIREFRCAFPLVSLTLEESSPHDLIERMQNDKIDIAFIGGPVANQEGVAIDPLLEELMLVALPAQVGQCSAG